MMHLVMCLGLCSLGLIGDDEPSSVKTYRSALLSNPGVKRVERQLTAPPARHNQCPRYKVDEDTTPRGAVFLLGLNDAYAYLERRNTDGAWARVILSPLRFFLLLSFDEKSNFQQYLHHYATYIQPDDMPYMSYKIRKLWKKCGLRSPHWIGNR